MSRKDTLISAVLINVALLGFLFIMAVPVYEQSRLPPKPQEVEVKEKAIAQEIVIPSEPKSLKRTSYDEIDDLLDHLKNKPAKKVVQEIAAAEDVKQEQFVTVQEGDYLGKIAKRHKVSVAALKAVNQLSSEKIRVGQKLKLPEESQEVDEEEFYTLKSGDNPWKISKKFGVPFYKLLEMNHLDQEKALHLKPGDQLRVR